MFLYLLLPPSNFLESVPMGSEAYQLHAFFIPLMAPGHIIPLTEVAKLFAQRGVKATIITTPFNASLVQKTVARARDSGFNIEIHPIKFPFVECDLPEGCENFISATTEDMAANMMKAMFMLEKPMEQLIRQHHPNCIVSDFYFPWTTDIASELGIPRIVFHGTGFFALCFADSLVRYKPHEKVVSETEPFIVPGLPDPIEAMRSHIPDYYKDGKDYTVFLDGCREAELRSFGVVVNSYYEMEPTYASHYKELLGRKAWHVGPVSLCNKDTEDKMERWNMGSIEEAECLRWLDSMQPNSVIYVCFGSLCQFQTSQLLEIAFGLESSTYHFIWVVREVEILKQNEEEEWLPRGFEERIKEKGLIIRGWAPQILILEHPAIGGFMTHCGWNSTIESVSAGVPMITWPLSAEQFDNEKLIVHVAKIGIPIGNGSWCPYFEKSVLVNRESIVEALEKLMGNWKEAEEMRKRTKKLGEMAKRAVEEGGSSYVDMDLLIDELTKFCAQHPTS